MGLRNTLSIVVVRETWKDITEATCHNSEVYHETFKRLAVANNTYDANALCYEKKV